MIVALGVLVHFWLTADEQRGQLDALSYYVGGQLVASGHGASLYDLAQQYSLANIVANGSPGSMNWPFVYPPWIAVICAPLATLPFDAAYVGFVLLQVLALGGASWQLAKLLPANQRILGILVMLLSASAVSLLGQPQWSAWPLWGLAGAFVAASEGNQQRSGLWVALGLVKPSLLLPGLLWLALRRQWRALAVLTGTGVVLSIAVVPWVGAWWTPYLSALSGQDAAVSDPTAMPTLRGLLVVLGLDPGLGGSVTLGGALLLGATLVAEDSDRPIVALLCGWLMLPHAYIHDLLLLAAPASSGRMALLLLSIGAALTWTSLIWPSAWLAGPLIAVLGLILVRRRQHPNNRATGGNDSPAEILETAASSR